MSLLHSFTETLIHSIWQSALLILVYVGVTCLLPDLHPLRKRNFLYGLLVVQLLISVSGFMILYTGYDSNSVISAFSDGSFFGFLNRYTDSIFLFYAAVVFIKTVTVVFHWQKFQQRWSHELIRPSSDLKMFTQLKSFHLGIKRKVTLWYSNHIHTPVTFGFFKPVILLPLSLVNHISVEQAEAIILHELSHIKSRDYLLNWLLIGMEIIYFFNPFVRLLGKKIRLEREKNCDVQVLNFEYDNLVYAEALLQTAKHGKAYQPFQLGAAASQLMKRILFFSKPGNIESVNAGRAKWSLAFVPLSLLLLFFATNRFQHAGNNNTDTILPISAVFSGSESFEPSYYNDSRSAAISSPAVSSSEENNITDIKPAIQPLAETGLPDAAAYDYTDENTPINVIPAAFNETPDSVKEFIYDVETPQGKMTQSFKMTLVNGQWVMQPQWMMMQTNADSCRMNCGDTIRMIQQMLPQ